MVTVEELDNALSAGNNPIETVIEKDQKATSVAPVDDTSTAITIEELDANLEQPIPTQEDSIESGQSEDAPVPSYSFTPTAYDPEEDLTVEDTVEYDSSYRSGFDRTSAAWEAWTSFFEDEDGNKITDEELLNTGNMIADELQGVSETSLARTSVRKSDPVEIAMGGLFRRYPAAMMHVVNALSVTGAAGLDVLEYVMESDKETGEKLGLPFNGYELTEGAINSLRGVSGVDTPAEAADFIGETILGSMEFFETLGAVGVPSKVVSAAGNLPRVEAKAAVKKSKRDAISAAEAISNSASIARGATSRARQDAITLAQEIAEQNKSIRDDLILEFESNLSGDNTKISKQVGDHLEIDNDLAADAARQTLRERFTVLDDAEGGVSVTEDKLSALIGSEEGLLSPVLNPDKLNGLVAVISEYKEKTKGLSVDPFNDPANSNKKTMRILLDMTVNKDIKATEELLNILNKYDLSFEDFILSSVGSFSDAGKILNVASQIKRVRPAGDVEAGKLKALMDRESDISNMGNRIEGARRGMLVGKFATAMRNLESYSIRGVGLEGLMNVIDGVTRSFNEPIKLGNDAAGGFLGAGKTLLSKDLWKDSFGTWKYTFERPDVANGFMELILEQPEFASTYTKMYDNLNEIQKASGRGSGTTADVVVSELENVVEMFNFANRWQENLTRNATAMSEIERLVRLEYKIDLRQAMQDGKLRDLINDASTVRPEGARSFSAIVADATDKALEVTYGAAPEGKMAKAITSFITTNKIGPVPLTVFVEFPRFMFSSMEYMAQSTFGAASPLLKKAVGIHKGPMTPKQQRAIQRNLVGAAAISAAAMYRSSEDAPAAFQDVRISGRDVDTTTQFPMRQYLYLGEVVKQIKKGTFSDFWDPKVFAETFVGQAFRTGSGNLFIEEVTAIADGLDISGGVKAAEIAGKQLADYMTTFFVPLSQFTDIQRGIPINETGETWRPNVYTDNPEPAPQSAIEAGTREIGKAFKRMGFGISPEQERSLEARETIFESDAERPDASLKTVLGVSSKQMASEDEEWVTRLNIPTWTIGSNSDIDSVKAFENKKIAEFLPGVIDLMQKREEVLGRKYDRSKPEGITKEAYILYNIKPLFTSYLTKLKGTIKKFSNVKADEYSRLTSEYNRIPKQFRKMAVANMMLDRDEDIDLLDIDTLKTLIVRAKQDQATNRKALGSKRK